MKSKIMTYIGSYSGTSKKGNDFTMSHFYCDPDENQKGIHGFTHVSFFPDDELTNLVLKLKPLQRVNVEYVYAGGSNVLVDIKELK